MTEQEIDSLLDLIFEQMFRDESSKGMLRLACDAEKNGILWSNYQGTLGASAFVVAIILASCGWPT